MMGILDASKDFERNQKRISTNKYNLNQKIDNEKKQSSQLLIDFKNFLQQVKKKQQQDPLKIPDEIKQKKLQELNKIEQKLWAENYVGNCYQKKFKKDNSRQQIFKKNKKLFDNVQTFKDVGEFLTNMNLAIKKDQIAKIVTEIYLQKNYNVYAQYQNLREIYDQNYMEYKLERELMQILERRLNVNLQKTVDKNLKVTKTFLSKEQRPIPSNILQKNLYNYIQMQANKSNMTLFGQCTTKKLNFKDFDELKSFINKMEPQDKFKFDYQFYSKFGIGFLTFCKFKNFEIQAFKQDYFNEYKSKANMINNQLKIYLTNKFNNKWKIDQKQQKNQNNIQTKNITRNEQSQQKRKKYNRRSFQIILPKRIQLNNIKPFMKDMSRKYPKYYVTNQFPKQTFDQSKPLKNFLEKLYNNNFQDKNNENIKKLETVIRLVKNYSTQSTREKGNYSRKINTIIKEIDLDYRKLNKNLRNDDIECLKKFPKKKI